MDSTDTGDSARTKDTRIEPRVLKGFRDFLPQQEMPRRRIMETLEHTFQSFGFVPIDTPILEYTDVLLGKGGGETDKQIYRFRDHGDRDVAMRFDLTVPFARFMAGHLNELYLPFKRYHIGKVYRGENTQRGRFREFAQCDFDIVGIDSASADFEILLLMQRSFVALGIDGITLRFAHRGIFNRFLKRIGESDRSVEILRAVDKIGKIGAEKTREILASLCGEDAASRIIDFITPKGSNEETLVAVTELSGGSSPDSDRVRSVLAFAEENGLSEYFLLDPSITRGLDYYTGIVFETFLDNLPEIGSVCSGGRYNDLASLYTKERIPGVGSSIGLDRLVAALEELDRLPSHIAPVDVLIFCLDDALIGYYHRLSGAVRGGGFSCEVYPEAKKIGAQFSYADRKGIPVGIFCGPDERSRDVLNVRNLSTKENFDGLAMENALEKIRTIVTEPKT